MSLREELFERVLAEPSRDHCAVYADHLVELGDPRGELINLELALEQPADAARRAMQKARRSALLAEHGPRWWPWLERGAAAFIKLRTRHGMVRELLKVPAERIARFPDGFNEEPIEALQIFGPGDPRLAAAGVWLPRLRRLRMSSEVDDQALKDVFLRAPELALVELRSNIRPLFDRTAPSLPMPSLEILELHGGLRTMTMPWLEVHAHRLRELRLPRARVAVDQLSFPVLEILETEPDLDMLARLCAAADRFPRLRRLDLHHFNLQEADVATLLDARLPRLAELGLRHTHHPHTERLRARYQVFRVR